MTDFANEQVGKKKQKTTECVWDVSAAGKDGSARQMYEWQACGGSQGHCFVDVSDICMASGQCQCHKNSRKE